MKKTRAKALPARIKKLPKRHQVTYQRMLDAYDQDEKKTLKVFNVYMDELPDGKNEPVDPIADAIKNALDAKFPNLLPLGNKGYTVKRSRGRGPKGFVVTRNT